ncbi:hypothetical protein HQK29_16825 [Vibrio vulnificus]|nr:hypothetical protein [Vibrio vulnificus]
MAFLVCSEFWGESGLREVGLCGIPLNAALGVGQ